MGELEKLKKEAKKLYLKAESFEEYSCGRNLAEHIKPEIGLARIEFNKVWQRIKALDPGAPDNPYA